MYRRIMHVFYGVALIGLAFVGQAQAVSLGKIDVASHLGEPFYAEVPLTLDRDEAISNVFVELASPADYRILEVFRDDALNQIRADVKQDSRGTRVELTSDSAMSAPFFNIVLKVRYARATYFKKYPVFLDLPRAAKAPANIPSPTVTAVKAPKTGKVTPVVTTAVPAVSTQQPAGFKPFDGWARTGRYGPMVFGDTITTVAQRLRVDNRFTVPQVMVALFDKNRQKFDKDNINLIKAGTFLDVPTAAEVERISPAQARQELAAQEKRWKELTKQPRYAAVAEAQRTRYSKRVRVGEEASGVATKPIEKTAPEGEKTTETKAGAPAPAAAPAGEAGATSAGQGEQAAALAALRAENDSLKKKLAESEAKAAKTPAVAPTADQAAAEARVKKLEIQLARMQNQLDRARQQASQVGGPLLNWVSYALIGVIVLLIAVVGVLLMRGGRRPHPALQEQAVEPEPTGGYEPAAFEEVKEIEVEEVPATDQNATIRMTSEEFEASLADSIPDLTDEDTSEMEPFQEAEEEADPNVDYLSEADVYLRYGMEDEAEKQVKMALRLRNDSKDAHIKLAEIRKARGDKSGLEQAVATARSTLSGDALAAFESALAAMGGVAGADEIEDTVPTPEEESVDETLIVSQPEAELAEGPGFDEVTVGEETGEEDESLGLGGIEWPTEEEAPAAEAEEEAAVKTEDTGELDFDFGAFELPEAGAAGEEATGEQEATEEFDFAALSAEAEETEGAGEEEKPAAAEEAGGGLDFDFGEFELPEAGAAAESEAAAEVAEEEKPAVAEEAGGGLDFDFGEFGLPEAGEGEEPVQAVGGEEATGELDLSALGAEAEDEKPAVAEEAGGGLDFDFGEFELPEGGEAEPAAAAVEPEGKPAAEEEEEFSFDFGDLNLAEETSDKSTEAEGGTSTLAMDWSGDTSSMAGEPAAMAEGGEIEAKPADFDLGEFDIDLSEEGGSDESFDEFSSTLQTNLAELSGQFEEEEGKATDTAEEQGLDLNAPEESGELDAGEFGLEAFQESTEEAVADSEAPAEKPSAGIDDLDMDSITEAVDRFRKEQSDDDLDFEATMRLDTLMGHMSKDEDKSSDDDKGNA